MRRSERDWKKLEQLQFTQLKSTGKKLDIMLASKNGRKNHGIHSEVISALNLPIAVQNKITKKKNEEPKTIKLNLPDDAFLP